MNNSSSRDVQDLIAEFVSSKNQLLHEEIISSIKRESFAGMLEEEKENASDDSTQIIQQAMKAPIDNMEALEKKVEELTARNMELQQELIMAQMQDSQNKAFAKPMGADDLRMEFLNFTSAHIQQFNNRIKKTEELIESLTQKAQNPNEKKSKNDYPQWLMWANILALGLIALYFLFQIFSGNEAEVVAKENPKTETPNSIENIPAKVNQPASVATKEIAPKVENQAGVATEAPAKVVSEPVSTPFHAANTAPVKSQTVEAKVLPSPEPKAVVVPQNRNVFATQNKMASPAPENKVTPSNVAIPATAKPAAIPSNTNIKPIAKSTQNVVNRAAPSKVQKETRPAVAATKIPQASRPVVAAPKVQNEARPTASVAKTPQTPKAVAAPANKPVADKKASNKDKVYFGED